MRMAHPAADLRAAAEVIRAMLRVDSGGSLSGSRAMHASILEIGATYGFGTADPRGVKPDGEALIRALEAKATALEDVDGDHAERR